jgi:hypothetical protein
MAIISLSDMLVIIKSSFITRGCTNMLMVMPLPEFDLEYFRGITITNKRMPGY